MKTLYITGINQNFKLESKCMASKSNQTIKKKLTNNFPFHYLSLHCIPAASLQLTVYSSGHHRWLITYILADLHLHQAKILAQATASQKCLTNYQFPFHPSHSPYTTGWEGFFKLFPLVHKNHLQQECYLPNGKSGTPQRNLSKCWEVKHSALSLQHMSVKIPN